MTSEIAAPTRALIGAAGGLLSLCAKFVGQDFEYFQYLLDANETVKMANLGIGYLVVGSVIILMGVIIALFVEESNKMKLLAIAVSAPALITTWSGSGVAAKLNPPKLGSLLISTAYAADASTVRESPSFIDGVKMFFGYGRDQKSFRVVVGSYMDPDEAERAAASLNKAVPGLGAQVGERRRGNPYYPVVISDYAPYSEAQARAAYARQFPAMAGAYLSPAP